MYSRTTGEGSEKKLLPTVSVQVGSAAVEEEKDPVPEPVY